MENLYKNSMQNIDNTCQKFFFQLFFNYFTLVK